MRDKFRQKLIKRYDPLIDLQSIEKYPDSGYYKFHFKLGEDVARFSLHPEESSLEKSDEVFKKWMFLYTKRQCINYLIHTNDFVRDIQLQVKNLRTAVIYLGCCVISLGIYVIVDSLVL